MGQIGTDKTTLEQAIVSLIETFHTNNPDAKVEDLTVHITGGEVEHVDVTAEIKIR